MKKFIFTTLLTIFVLGAYAQESTNPVHENDGLTRWSLGIKGGANLYRVTPFTDAVSPSGGKYTSFEQRIHAVSWNGSLFLEYNPTPVFGIGLVGSYINYDRNGQDGDAYKYYGNTIDAVLYSTINISNLVSPQRTGGWKKVSFYASVGVGGAGYTYKKTPSLGYTEGESGFDDYADRKFSMILMTNAGLDFSLAPWLSFMLESEYRYYNMARLGGEQSSSKGDDAFFVNAGFRFKFGGKRHVRNMTYDEYYGPRTIIQQVPYDQSVYDRLAAVESENAAIKSDVAAVKSDVQEMKNDIKEIKDALTQLNQKEVVQKVTATAENIEFKTGSAILTEESKYLLDDVAALLNSIAWIKLDIAGHTDNTGNADKNKKLSQERADAVKNYLVDKGLDANKMSSVGYGSERPIASNNTEAGRQRNRRVEFAIK